MSDQDSSKSTPFTVFDYLGLGFILEPPAVLVHAVMTGEPLQPSNALYAIPFVIVGAICIYIGRHWDNLKYKTNNKIIGAVERLSKSYIIPFIIILFMLSGIATLPIIIWPPSSKFSIAIHDQLTAENVAKATTPTAKEPLSDEEKSFRLNLRTLILSTLSKQISVFIHLADQLYNDGQVSPLGPDKNKIDALDEMIRNLIRLRLDNNYENLSREVDKDIALIDVPNVISALRLYIDAYSDTEIYFRDFLTASDINPNKTDLFARWIDSDNMAVQLFDDLKTSPIAKNTGFINVIGFQSAITIFRPYIRQPNSMQPQVK